METGGKQSAVCELRAAHVHVVVWVWDGVEPVTLGSLRVHRTVTSSGGQRRARLARGGRKTPVMQLKTGEHHYL